MKSKRNFVSAYFCNFNKHLLHMLIFAKCTYCINLWLNKYLFCILKLQSIKNMISFVIWKANTKRHYLNLTDKPFIDIFLLFIFIILQLIFLVFQLILEHKTNKTYVCAPFKFFILIYLCTMAWFPPYIVNDVIKPPRMRVQTVWRTRGLGSKLTMKY